VRLGDTVAIAGPDGVATLTTPRGANAGTLRLTATAEGMIDAFPRRVRVR
jgi:hypothetical protein